MKLLLVVWLYGCSIPLLNAQDFNDFAATDRKVLQMPTTETYSSASIAGYVQSNFKTEKEKLRAIYTWVISNIRYDKDSMYHINWSMYPEEKIAATLRRRRGVCENYAALFTDIAIKSGFQSFVISGYIKQGSSAHIQGHSWSAVYLEGEWFLCDPTWDVGSRGNTNYFLVSPAQFIESHIPFDPLWQLLDDPPLHVRGEIFQSKKSRESINVADSVKAFLQLDSLRQLETSANRIKQAGIKNENSKNWVAYNQMKIAIIYGEKDMNSYNSAVADLNKANNIFNDFVEYRNNRFIPVRPDLEITSLLDPISGLLSSAWKNLEQLGKTVENFQYDTGTIKDRLTGLTRRVKEQETFLKQYLASAPGDREKLFYK